MLDFRDYPLRKDDEAIANMADEMGYEVIDFLPVFQEKLIDGSKYRLFNDNHFNSYVHGIVADSVKRYLDGRADR